MSDIEFDLDRSPSFSCPGCSGPISAAEVTRSLSAVSADSVGGKLSTVSAGDLLCPYCGARLGAVSKTLWA